MVGIGLRCSLLHFVNVSLVAPVQWRPTSGWNQRQIKDRALASTPIRGRGMWTTYRYAITQGGQPKGDEYLTNLNNVHHKLTFTYEIELERSLAFLDVLVDIRLDST